MTDELTVALVKCAQAQQLLRQHLRLYVKQLGRKRAVVIAFVDVRRIFEVDLEHVRSVLFEVRTSW